MKKSGESGFHDPHCVWGRIVAKSSPSRSVSLWWVARRYCPPDTIVLFVYRTRKLRIHTAGECVMSRSVAKGSFAFRSRAKDTWCIAPGKVGSKRQENSSRDAVWRKSPLETFVSPGNKRETISNVNCTPSSRHCKNKNLSKQPWFDIPSD